MGEDAKLGMDPTKVIKNKIMVFTVMVCVQM